MGNIKYKPGDIVNVRRDLNISDIYDHYYITGAMSMYRGGTVTIDSVEKDAYRIKEMGCFWTDEMFEDCIIASKNISEHERCDDNITYSETSESDLLKLYKPRGKS